jgi:hypothetical protein
MPEGGFGPEKPPANEVDFESDTAGIVEELNKLNVHQLRRLTMSLNLVSSDEIVLGDEEGFKNKVVDHLKVLKERNPREFALKIPEIRTKIGNIDHI